MKEKEKEPTRKTTMSTAMTQPKDDENQEVKSASAGWRFLEHYQLTVPCNNELTAESLVISLFYTSKLKGMLLPTRNTICSVAYLLQEMDSNRKAEIIA